MMLRPLLALSLLVAVLLLAATGLAPTAEATTVLRLTPEQVDTLAQRIIEGRCVEACMTTLPGTSATATEYVFAVERVLKGDGLAERVQHDGGRLIVRQLGGVASDGRNHLIVGMPRYEVGQRYRLALNGESELGLTSPVGFGQGVTRLPDMPAAAAAQAPAP